MKTNEGGTKENNPSSKTGDRDAAWIICSKKSIGVWEKNMYDFDSDKDDKKKEIVDVFITFLSALYVILDYLGAKLED